MSMPVIDPISIEVFEIRLIKHRTNRPQSPSDPEYIELLPQLLQFNIYQSIFEPFLKAELTIADTIGIRSNFPLLGEEIIRVSFRDTQQLRAGADKGIPNNLEFSIVSTSQSQFDDTGKMTTYVFHLISTEAIQNSKIKLAKAYFSNYTDMIRDIVSSVDGLNSRKRFIGIQSLTDDLLPEITDGRYHIVVPSMHPAEAINWMCDRSVSADPSNFFFVFFEKFGKDISGFYFNTIQSLIRYGKRKLNEPPATTNTFKHFVYTSNYNSSMDAIVKGRLSLPDSEPVSTKFITNLSMNKRFSTIEKIMSGFFENHYVEFDIWDMQIRQHQAEADRFFQISRTLGPQGLRGGQASTASPYQINTPNFVSDMITGGGPNINVSKTVYKIRINGGDQPGEPDNWPKKIGEALRIRSAFSQFSVSLTLPGDTRVQAGDMIKLDVPLSEGFTEENLDPYLSGYYLITDIKHAVYTNNRYTMVINANRDSFNEPLFIEGTSDPIISRYRLDNPASMTRDRI